MSRIDARALVRLLQCAQCSRPFTQPVTFLCGHTVCRSCLPPPQERENISYPNTPEHRMGLSCPCCGEVQSVSECNVDITLSNFMSWARNRIGIHIGGHADTPMTPALEELSGRMGAVSLDKEGRALTPQPKTYHGGPVASTFQMAEEGLLPRPAELGLKHLEGGDNLQELDTKLLHILEGIVRNELDCPLCYQLLLDPITTPCGHTLCQHCLRRVFDHDDSCPVCRQQAHMSRSLAGHHRNRTLVALLDTFCPETVSERRYAVQAEESSAEGTLDTPLFICMMAIPTMPAFLHIFEPRYRLMIRRCLEGNRQFGMLDYNRNQEPQGDLGVTPFKQLGTMLRIVHHNLLPDGRSYLECVGVDRFRVLEHGLRDGYHVGRIERVEDMPLSQEKALEELDREQAPMYAAQYASYYPHDPPLTQDNFPGLLSTDDLFHYCYRFVQELRAKSDGTFIEKSIRVYGECPDKPDLFPWWFVAVIPKSPIFSDQEAYDMLGLTSVRERLKTVYLWTKRLQARLRPSCTIL